jgi:hypoxanthine phosphoribosyltransferase
MSFSSFNGGIKSSGEVKILKDLDAPVDGCDVLVVEDILDSGRTLSYIMELIWPRRPQSIKICALLDKPEIRQSAIEADYVGKRIPNEFVVGYGFDYKEIYRNLPFIGVLKDEIFISSL